MNMKDIFSQYFKDKEEIKEIWKDCIFVFDANVIIDLYRYSESTKKSLLDSLRQFKGRAWITYQASEEYLRNRSSVIAGEEVHYTDASKKIDEFVSTFKAILGKNRQHPFISEEASNEFFMAAEKIKKELEDNGKKYFSRVSDDEIRKELVRIFEGQVGEGFSYEELNNIFENGIERYKNQVPPGYEDVKKYSGVIDDGNMTFEEKKRVFGDLIIWEEVINKSESDSKNVILITGDVKDDWWKKSKGKNLGPRVELIKEFEERTGQKFYMYTAYQFLDISSKDRGSESVKDAVEEIREVNTVFSNKKMSWFDSEIERLAKKNKTGEKQYFFDENEGFLNEEQKERDTGFIFYHDNLKSDYNGKMYMLKKEVNELNEKSNLLEKKINRYKARLEELNNLEDYLGISEKENKNIVILNNILSSLIDLQEKVSNDLLSKRLEIEFLSIKKDD